MTNQYEDAAMGAAEEAELTVEALDQSPEEEIEATVQAEIAADKKLSTEIIETTAVVVKDTMSLSDVMQLGSIALASGNFPDLRNNEQAIVRIMAGRELGLQPMTALRDLYVVEGKVAMSSGLIASMVRNHPKYDYRITTMDNDMCELEFFEGEFPIGKSKFTIEDAKQAGIYRQGSGWTKYPRNMLFARALTNGARWYCPDAFDGAVYTPEELKPVEVSTTNYSNAPVSGAVTNAQPPEQVWGSQAATPSIDAQPQTRSLYPVGISADDLKNEACPVHLNHPASMSESRGRPVEFFKKGAMRSHAHPTGPREARAPWCSWQSMADDLKQEAGDVLTEAGYADGGEMRSIVEAVFDDLIDIPLTAYRIADWKAIADYDWQDIGGSNAESTTNEAEQNTLL
tara:strand:- start:4069 stop:5268 length:1200 start_codon:yes stop_codon:yes gene_type:complete